MKQPTISLRQSRHHHVGISDRLYFVDVVLFGAIVKQLVEGIQHGHYFHGRALSRNLRETHYVAEVDRDVFVSLSWNL
jgi:hypothetical protein